MGDQEQDLAQQIASAVAQAMEAERAANAQAMEAERAANAQAIADAVRNALREQVPRSRQRSPERTEAPAITTSLPSFKAEEIGYFHPDLDKSYGEGDVVFSGKDTLIRDVHLFCDRIRDVAELRGPNLVKASLPGCLRGIALQWYMHELSQGLKLGMRHDTGVQIWCDELTKRFKTDPSKALDKLYAAKYTMDDARNQREPIDHVQAVIRYGKSAALNEENQLIFAWKGLDPQLQRDIRIPRSDTTVAEFI